MNSKVSGNEPVLSLLSKNDDSHITKLSAEIIIFLLLVYVHFGLYIQGLVPYWTFCLGLVMYVSRWMINLHDYLHLVKPQDTNWFIRYHLLILSPFSYGYREIRDIHMRHHAYTVTEKDPDLYHIKRNLISSFVLVTLSPEISTYYYIRDKGFDRELFKGLVVRSALFVAFIVYFGMTSLYYFIPVRLVYGACMFSISFPLHRKGGEYGTYTPNYHPVLQTFMTALFGTATLNTLSHHDIHHDYPKIAAINLPKARDYYQPKNSSLVNQSQEEIFTNRKPA